MIDRTERDSIVTLTLNHGKAAALDVELMQALDREIDATEGAGAVILTGTGSIFCAGVDLFRLTNEGVPYVREFFPMLRDVIRKLFALPRPVVVAANGHAIAGGCILICCGDARLMADGNGRIGVAELLVGVPFPAVALETVRFAAPARAQQLVYTGVTVPAREAVGYGLLDEVVDPAALLERAHEVARQLAAIPPETFRLTKHHLRAPALERMSSLGESNDGRALAVWSDPAIHQRIREYLARTVRK